MSTRNHVIKVQYLYDIILFCEVWKSLNIVNYPIQLEPNSRSVSGFDRQVRPGTSRLWNQDAKTTAEKECFSRSAAKLWNNIPLEIKNSTSLVSAKKAIKIYCKSLPVWMTWKKTIQYQYFTRKNVKMLYIQLINCKANSCANFGNLHD